MAALDDVVIISGCRTPVGKFQGSLSAFTAPQLGAIVVREAVKRAGLDPQQVDECIMGNVVSAGLGQNPARQAAIYGGLSPEVGAMTINKVCGSGLKAVALAAQATSGVEPKWVMMAPVGAVRKIWEKTGWKKDEVDLYELNEAFSVQALGVIRELGLDMNRVNVNGGAVALGHPIGASGARVLVTLIYEMIRRDLRRGIAALCLGGGNAVAMAVER